MRPFWGQAAIRLQGFMAVCDEAGVTLAFASLETWKGREQRRKGLFFSFVLAFICLSFPWGKAQCGISGSFFCLQEIPVKRSEDFIYVRCFCILSPNHLGEKE